LPELRYRCPDQIHRVRTGKSDKKGKLYLNPAKNVAHCFSCNFKTRDAKAFAEPYGLPIDVPISATASPALPSLQLPPEYSTSWHTASGHQSWKYLRRRELTPSTIAGYELGYCDYGRYQDRIIIPVFQDGNLVNFQARDYTGRSPVRYLNPPGALTSRLFNLERASQTGLIVLVEGPFDALRLPAYAVALMGKGWNAAKRTQILRVQPQTVLLALDQDGSATREAAAIRSDLCGIVPQVEALPLPYKDFGDASPSYLREIATLCRMLCPSAPMH